MSRNKIPSRLRPRLQWSETLCYVRSELLAILPLNRLHLVFEPQLQLLEPHFLQLFIFAEVTFLGERVKTAGILHVLLSQLAEFIMRAQESVIRSQHPGRPPTGNLYGQITTALITVQCRNLVQSLCEKP